MSIASAVGSILTAGANNYLAGLREQNAREENYYYNEKAAQNADTRTRALYNDLYSPAAQMAQLKEAGLSPSIYASGGLAGKQGVSGAQGGGPNGISPNVFGIDPMAASQIELNKALAEKADSESINIQEDTTVKRLEQTSLRIKNIVDSGTIDSKISYIENLVSIQDMELNNLAEDLRTKTLNNEYLEKTLKPRIDQENINNLKTISEIVVNAYKAENINRNTLQMNYEVNKWYSEFMVEMRKIHQKDEELEITRDWYNTQYQMFLKSIGLQEDQLEWDKDKNEVQIKTIKRGQTMQLVSNLFDTVVKSAAIVVSGGNIKLPFGSQKPAPSYGSPKIENQYY